MKLINKKAKFEYELIKEFEAGIVLSGAEVKAIRSNAVDFSGSHVAILDSEAYVINLHIGVEAEADTRKRRKLLLHKNEILELATKRQAQGLTIIPVSLYNRGSRIKLRIALARGRKSHDKRDYKKQQDIQREIDRELKDMGTY